MVGGDEQAIEHQAVASAARRAQDSAAAALPRCRSRRLAVTAATHEGRGPIQRSLGCAQTTEQRPLLANPANALQQGGRLVQYVQLPLRGLA
mgnify:CR=1 FL=1